MLFDVAQEEARDSDTQLSLLNVTLESQCLEPLPERTVVEAMEEVMDIHTAQDIHTTDTLKPPTTTITTELPTTLPVTKLVTIAIPTKLTMLPIMGQPQLLITEEVVVGVAVCMGVVVPTEVVALDIMDTDMADKHQGMCISLT